MGLSSLSDCCVCVLYQTTGIASASSVECPSPGLPGAQQYEPAMKWEIACQSEPVLEVEIVPQCEPDLEGESVSQYEPAVEVEIVPQCEPAVECEAGVCASPPEVDIHAGPSPWKIANSGPPHDLAEAGTCFIRN